MNSFKFVQCSKNDVWVRSIKWCLTHHHETILWNEGLKIKKVKAKATTWCHCHILLDKKRNEKWEDRYSARFWNGFTFTSFSSSSTFSRSDEEERGSQIDEPFIGLPPYVLSSFWGNVISDLEWSREMMSATYHLPENLNPHIFN